MRIAVMAALVSMVAWIKPDDKPCDLKKIEDAPWCSKCKAVKAADGIDKEGKCTDCSTKTEKVKVCVKAYYKAPC